MGLVLGAGVLGFLIFGGAAYIGQRHYEREAHKEAERIRTARAAEEARLKQEAERQKLAQERQAKIKRITIKLEKALGQVQSIDYRFRDVKKPEDWTWELVKKFERDIEEIRVSLNEYLEQELPGTGAAALVRDAVGQGGQSSEYYEYTRLHSMRAGIRSVLERLEFFVDRASQD